MIFLFKISSPIDNEIRRVNAVRGFSVVECFDLARIGNYYFQPTSHQLAKKFGLFSCTGGQIRLHFAINRSAFVCGEHMIIEGWRCDLNSAMNSASPLP
jgi:hypothetical protein